eukprot:CAMPEP_0202049690 /NCGR_PEP_ID=MMETSP0963-20130614/3548_1 /ASSEMBLY_ACC=CAM_ASM_000494 /TAXON_ID=4773 /ORGANISM="Schizochytrium aggregatum, Strain ATCC28209" /LENGTH=321 /DNA_ID=CAMNT_0048614723 /DNA_START=137 /DNA_END=1098 /DNA_ORIENTATION=-
MAQDGAFKAGVDLLLVDRVREELCFQRHRGVLELARHPIGGVHLHPGLGSGHGELTAAARVMENCHDRDVLRARANGVTLASRARQDGVALVGRDHCEAVVDPVVLSVKLAAHLVDPFAQRDRGVAKVKGRTCHVRHCANGHGVLIDRNVGGTEGLERVVLDRARGLAAEVPVHVVADVDHGGRTILRELGLVHHGELASLRSALERQGIARSDRQLPGEALLAVLARVAKEHTNLGVGLEGVEDVPVAHVKRVSAPVEGKRSRVCGDLVLAAVELELGVGDAVGHAAARGAGVGAGRARQLAAVRRDGELGPVLFEGHEG